MPSCRFVPPRMLRRALAPVALILTTTSAVSLDPFVASGDYARSIALIADCRRVFIPAMNPADRPTPRTGVASFVSFPRSGEGLAYAYRPATLTPGSLRSDAGAEYDWLPAPSDMGTRMDVYETDTEGTSVASSVSSGGCARISMSATPRILQVGIPAGGEGGTDGPGNEVVTLEKFSRLAYPSGGAKADRYYGPRRDANTIRAVNPDTVTGAVVLRAYLDGQAVPSQVVRLYADPRGVPEPGHTYPHAHIARGDPDLAPSILIVGQNSSRGNPFARSTVQTGPDGSVTFKIHPGYRGGPEAIIATAKFASMPDSTRDARMILVQHRGGLVAWTVATNHAQGLHEPPPSPDFPFLMTGWTERHPNNHFVRADIATTMAQMFHEIWLKDRGRAASKTPRYLQLNDMSLEYGGLFKLGSSAEASRCMTSEGSHKTHLGGIDFDVSPCFSEGGHGTAPVGSEACERDVGGTQYLKMDEALLAAIVVGNYGGAIYEHHKFVQYNGAPLDGAPYHYHLRFPDHAVANAK
jgi:hypothetical protein